VDNYLTDLKFYRIITGYFEIRVNDQKYKIIYPDIQKKYEAEQLYVSLMQDSRFDTEYLNSAQLEKILIHNEIWSHQEQEKLDGIEEHINKIKIRLYQNYSNDTINKEAKTELKVLRDYQNELLSKKHSLDYLTLDFFAKNIKNQFLISQCTLTLDGRPVFEKDYYKMDPVLLKSIANEIEKHQITAEDLRAICMSDAWKRYLCQDNIFGPSIHFNDDQANLLSLQKMYDNVRQHPECPEEEIISDPDALDGWFLYQKEKNKHNKKKNEALDKVRGKVGGHEFVYVITRDQKEAAAIDDLNDHRGKQLVSAVRNNGLKEGESMKWRDIPFIKQEIQSKIYQNQKQGVPNK